MSAFYFSFSNAGGFDAHKTLEEAKAAAESALDNERDNAGDEGWEEDDTTSICYGSIHGGVEEIARMAWNDHLRQQGTPEEDLPAKPRFDQFVDYRLEEYALAGIPDPAGAIEKVREALLEIAAKKGRFSRDPETHARNCIEDMAAHARRALAALGGKP